MFGFFKRKRKEKQLSPATSGGWRPLIIGDIFTGAWQKGEELQKETSLTHYAVFTCLSLISQSIAQLPFIFVKQKNGVLKRTKSEILNVLRKPNYYQNHIQFKEAWMLSKLMYGNTYVLKVRDSRDKVIGYHILNPTAVQPLVSDSGIVYYKLSADNLSAIDEEVTVPASEILHDRFNCFYHPLVGISPLSAASLSVKQGLKIQENSTTFFSNKAVPSGLLIAPGSISDETANRMKKHWEANYSGNGAGKVAVLGDGLKFEPMAMTALDSQLIEQLKLTAEVVCSVFKVHPYLAGISDKRPQETVEAIHLEFLQKTLQFHIESMEAVLDDANGLDGVTESIDLDTANMLRMDTVNRYKSHSEGLKAGFRTINEVRASEGLDPVTGGDTPYLQQQNFSLEALAKRDAKEDPFSNRSEPGSEPVKDPEADAKALLKGLIEGFKNG